jgi:SAM-dependent methyltransferase
MRDAYKSGSNAMAAARERLEDDRNHILSTLIAYDLQAGSYTQEAAQMPAERSRWCEQVAALLRPFLEDGSSVLEVGCGEATTFRGVIEHLGRPDVRPLGFDLSWSRLRFARECLRGSSVQPDLFAADLFNIPLGDATVDVVYTSHSLEPNGGREVEALRELTRVARKAVVVIEPIYELASDAAQRRMAAHGYVRNLKAASEEVGKVTTYELLPFNLEALNPSGVVVIELNNDSNGTEVRWRCPVTGHRLVDHGDAFFAAEAGLAYPVLRNVPILLPHYAIIASRFGDEAAESRR